jgi:hypothetical protein
MDSGVEGQRPRPEAGPTCCSKYKEVPTNLLARVSQEVNWGCGIWSHIFFFICLHVQDSRLCNCTSSKISGPVSLSPHEDIRIEVF